MKANAPKRKVFQDAVDLLGMPEAENAQVSNGTIMISVEKIVPFHNHPFRLYEGERLDDMVESIKEHGILIPVIVQKVADKYEMLAGHNRWNAAKIVGIKDIPAIIKENLTEREAYAYELKTGMSRTKLAHLMDAETWMDANKAIELGFADEIIQRTCAVDEVEVPQVSMLYSKTAVVNSLMERIAEKCKIQQKEEIENSNKVKADSLMSRLNLMKNWR